MRIGPNVTFVRSRDTNVTFVPNDVRTTFGPNVTFVRSRDTNVTLGPKKVCGNAAELGGGARGLAFA